ncbi:hemerythrin domain-containing protein [Nesterenkonia rhizosphaerae]
MSTSIAEQSTAELGGRLSVLTRQRNDHIELDKLLNKLDQTHGPEQDQVLLDIYRLVFPHAFAEESVLWPVMRRVLDDGQALTLEVEQEHQEVNELVSRLEGMEHSDEQRAPVLARLIEVLREDVRDEEDELFPRLQRALAMWQVQALGLAWEVLRRTAPTRAHPVVARRPPGNVLAAVPLTILDRARDALDYRALRTPGTKKASAIRSLSTALGHAAARVERLPIMRQGEDPSTRLAGHSAGT